MVGVLDNKDSLFEKNQCKSLLCNIWILYRSQKKLSQYTFSCSNSAIETLMFRVNNKLERRRL